MRAPASTRRRSRSQQTRQFFIQGRDAFARVDYPHQRDCFINGDRRLFENVRGNYRVVVGNNSACIDDCDLLTVPLTFAVNPVARNTRFIANNRSTLADQAIEQGRLAHVGPADDCNQRQLFLSGFGHREWSLIIL